MPVLMDIRKRFIDEQPLAGLKIGMALHTEAKTGMLAVTLADAGAKIRLASCNPCPPTTPWPWPSGRSTA